MTTFSAVFCDQDLPCQWDSNPIEHKEHGFQGQRLNLSTIELSECKGDDSFNLLQSLFCVAGKMTIVFPAYSICSSRQPS